MRFYKLIAIKISQFAFTPLLVVIMALILAGSFSFAISPQRAADNSQPSLNPQTNLQVLGDNLTVNLPSAAPLQSSTPSVATATTLLKKTTLPSPSILPTASTNISTAQLTAPSSSPTATSNPAVTASSTPAPSSLNTSSKAPSPTPTTTPLATITPSPSLSLEPQVNEVSLEIKSPSSNSTFKISISEGMDVCAVLQKARDEGKISSLTFDDSYLSTFNSKYVFEINGFKNNWTFKVNGESPLGCSLFQVKPNDSIVWEYK